MKQILSLLVSLFKMAILSLILSAVIAFFYWLTGVIFGKDNDFLIPFIGGAAGIFGLYFVYSIIHTILTLIRFQKDPIYKDAYTRGVVTSWKDYQASKNKRNCDF